MEKRQVNERAFSPDKTLFPGSRQATSVEVARLAGVHRTTVSRVLNNPGLVNNETLNKVKQAISILNYRPWSQARSLATKRHEMVGLVTDLPQKMSSHHVDLVEGVVESLTEAHYAFTMAKVPRKATPEQLMELSIVRRHSCDGFIFNLESAGKEVLDISAHLGVPCIWVNPAFHAPFDCVVPDDQEIAETATNYLISRGHRRIAYLNGSVTGHRLSIERRRHGYEMAMLRAKLDPMPLFDKTVDDEGIYEEALLQAALDPNLHDKIISEKEIEKRLSQKTVLEKSTRERLAFWLEGPTPPTGIVTYGSGSAVRVARIAYWENWRIPTTFSLVACDDNTSLEDLAIPVTAVKTNRRLCGIQGAKMLFEKLRTGASVPSVQVQGELVERESVLSI